MYKVVEDIKPDIIALGFDQIHDEEKIINDLKKRKLTAKIVRLQKYKGREDLEGTRRIIRKIISAYEFQKKMDELEGR